MNLDFSYEKLRLCRCVEIFFFCPFKRFLLGFFFCHIMRRVRCLSARAESLLRDDEWKPSRWKSGTDDHVISNISKHFDLLHKFTKTWHKSLTCILSHSTSKVETLCKRSIITLRPSFTLHCWPFGTRSGNTVSPRSKRAETFMLSHDCDNWGCWTRSVLCSDSTAL